MNLPFDQPVRPRSRSFDSRLNCLLRPKAGATYLEASLRMTGFSLSAGVVVVPAGTAGPFGSRLNCLLRPNAGATYSDASLRMTGFLLSSGVVAAPAGTAGPFDSRSDCLLRPNAGATYSDASLRMTEFLLMGRTGDGGRGHSLTGSRLAASWLFPIAGASSSRLGRGPLAGAGRVGGRASP